MSINDNFLLKWNKILPKNEQKFCRKQPYVFPKGAVYAKLEEVIWQVQNWHHQKKIAMFFLVKAARVNGNLTIP